MSWSDFGRRARHRLLDRVASEVKRNCVEFGIVVAVGLAVDTLLGRYGAGGRGWQFFVLRVASLWALMMGMLVIARWLFPSVRPQSGQDEPRGPFAEHARNRLEAIRTLPRDWDGHGSEPPGDEAGYDAGWLLHAIARREPDLPPPNINATRGGRIQIDWERGGRYFEVTVPGGGEAWLFYEEPAAGVSREWERPLPECLDDVLEHSRRVAA